MFSIPSWIEFICITFNGIVELHTRHWRSFTAHQISVFPLLGGYNASVHSLPLCHYKGNKNSTENSVIIITNYLTMSDLFESRNSFRLPNVHFVFLGRFDVSQEALDRLETVKQQNHTLIIRINFVFIFQSTHRNVRKSVRNSYTSCGATYSLSPKSTKYKSSTTLRGLNSFGRMPTISARYHLPSYLNRPATIWPR